MKFVVICLSPVADVVNIALLCATVNSEIHHDVVNCEFLLSRYVEVMKKTLPFSIRLDADLKSELQRLADADRRSLTNLVEVILYNFVGDVRNVVARQEHEEAERVKKGKAA